MRHRAKPGAAQTFSGLYAFRSHIERLAAAYSLMEVNLTSTIYLAGDRERERQNPKPGSNPVFVALFSQFCLSAESVRV
jgi:hypothetical protein